MTQRPHCDAAERDPPRVLIVDDSAVARAALSRFVTASGRFALAGALPDAARALAFLRHERVDFILLDLVMPHQSGIEALPDLLEAGGGARVLVVSSSAAEGAAVTMRALALGAADTLVKPGIGAFASRFGETLLARLDMLAAGGEARPAPRRATVLAPPPFDAIAIGASTGGIHALASLLEQVPAHVAQPIFITQHLPPSFSPYFAVQVGVSAHRPCAIAQERGGVRAGEVLIAPGDAHLLAVSGPDGQVATRLSQAPSPTGNLPSVDPMFASLAQVYGPRLLAIVLTGMGRDGLEGARAVRAAGGTVVVQDRESSVVWGMPGAVAAAGLADAVLAPHEIGAMIAARRSGARA
ncbi:two-component system chemotaxis response regulator CheB [Sphingomonas sp. BE138]|uniref:chemotaxis protein CheB n=1 Tax=Sphingomonas sp. BE138 TaxID=2817845 RepID=UPI002857D16C|nr:chemotaxis protein CheB [Sphingomonas sp. BE138]MDR6789650.1 two-component system chemotaxis response regulator CheB [Sphingomonas sp. BE138]